MSMCNAVYLYFAKSVLLVKGLPHPNTSVTPLCTVLKKTALLVKYGFPYKTNRCQSEIKSDRWAGRQVWDLRGKFNPNQCFLGVNLFPAPEFYNCSNTANNTSHVIIVKMPQSCVKFCGNFSNAFLQPSIDFLNITNLSPVHYDEIKRAESIG